LLPDYFRFDTTVFHTSSDRMCDIIPTGHNMKFPHFASRKNTETLSKQDEKIFAEASELAQLRLEQTIADLRITAPTFNATSGPGRDRSLAKVTNLI
jgi:hypothetical protein